MTSTNHRSWYQSDGSDVCICATGTRTPLGLTAASSAAAVRCGISAISAQEHFVDSADEPMALAVDSLLEHELSLTARMECLLATALNELEGPLLSAPHQSRLMMWLGLPESRPGLPANFDELFALACRTCPTLEPSAIRAIERGNAAGLMAMQAAAQSISDGTADICIAAAVELS